MCWYAVRRATADTPTAPPPNGRAGATAERFAAPGARDELESSAVLATYGLPMVGSTVVTSPAGAAAAAAVAGFPVVLKALAPGVAHKHELGLVAVGLPDAAAVRAAYATLAERLGAAGHSAAATTFVLQPMIAGELEVIAGVSWEGELGHFIVFGLGGVHAELLDEVLLLPVPLGRATVRERVVASRAGRLLAAVASDPAALFEAVVDVLVALQAVVADHGERIASIDVNPLVARGADLVAVDALLVTR
jgi:acyl-CoA synthetase (NDP forming)